MVVLKEGTEAFLSAGFSAGWVLNALAGMHFVDSSGRDAYDYLKTCFQEDLTGRADADNAASGVEEARRLRREQAFDEVARPKHYNDHPSGVECIEIVEHMTFCTGNAVKYVWRAGLKLQGDEMTDEARVRDLEKARWYLDREIARLKRGAQKP